MIVARPFLKWVGGKTQLLPTLLGLFPKKMRHYYEPFLGGGAVFFAVAAEKRFQGAILSDWNRELINCYRVVRDFPDELLAALDERVLSYDAAPKSIYERWKALDPATLDPVVRASRIFLLNKTCFNGLYRTNKAGKFNVPWGKKLKARLCDPENIQACSEVLNRPLVLRSGDFTEALDDATHEDFVYFDPPYYPLTKTSNFASYTEGKFTDSDHYRLAALFKDLVKRGVKVVLSNSDMPEVRALYQDFEMVEVQARRAVNSKGDKRGPVGELIIIGRSAAACSALPRAWT